MQKSAKIKKLNNSEDKKLDLIIWFAISGLALLAFLNQYQFRFCSSLLLRFLLTIGLLFTAIYIALNKTVYGVKAKEYLQNAILELKKVYWPTKKEAIQTTAAVFAMVAVIGLILWTVDSLLVRLVAFLLRRSGV